MRRAWMICGIFAVVAAVIVWALAPSGREDAHVPDLTSLAPASRSTSPEVMSEGLSTSRITPKPFEDAEASTRGLPIRVLVVDADGHPVDEIGVALVLKMADRDPWTTTITFTDRDGIAILRRPTHVSVNPDIALQWVVTAVPFVQPPEAIVDVDRPPADPIRLVIGPTGRAVVHLMDAAHHPVLEHAEVQLATMTADGRKVIFLVGTRSIDDGKAVFERVGLGTMLWAGARCQGRRYQSSVTGEGPRLAGAEIALTLVVDVSRPFVTGRIMNERGEPWSDTNFQGHVLCGDPKRSPGSVNIRTDAAGRFRVEIVEPLFEGQERRLEIDHAADAHGVGVDAHGAVDLTRTLPPGDTNVGDVALSPTPLIVSGVVLDENGNPVGGAGLTMQGAETAGPNAQWNWIPGLDHLPPADAEGKFAIRGVCKAAVLRIAAHAPNCWAENPVEFTPRRENVVLHVHPAGGIEGSVELPDGVQGKDVAIEVRIEDDGDPAWKAYGSAVWTPAAEDGSFRLDQLRCSSFRVLVKPPGEFFLPVEITGVVVRAGERTRDPRLQKIRIPSRGRPVFLDVVDSNGEPIGGASAAPVGLPAGPMAYEHVVRAKDSRIRVFVPSASADFVVGAWGYRRKSVTVVSDQKVVLEKGIPIRFVVTGLDAPLPDGVRANIAMSPETVAAIRNRRPEDLVGQTSGDTIDPVSHAASFLASDPGRCRFWIDAATSRRSALLAEGTVDVADVSTRQTFTATIKADALHAALEKLDSK